jgi:hypothetical protein
MENTKHTPGPYRLMTSVKGTYYVEGPGTLTARFESYEQATGEHFVTMLNDAWTRGRRTGRQDHAIAKAVELEPMKPDPEQ